MKKVNNKVLKVLGLGFIALLVVAMFPMCHQNEKLGVQKSLIIHIQPYDGIKDISKDVEKFEDYLNSIGLKNYQIKILPNDVTPRMTDIRNGNPVRLRADTMIKLLDIKTDKGEFTIGVTNRDVACTVHGVQDFGVLGLSFLGNKYKSCMTSTYRLKDKKDLWKLMAHEFTHAYFSQKHCKANDPHCIMQDANKKPNFGIKDSLCVICLKEIRSKMR